jgi:flagellar biosynthesis/type III secretory pathway protein FliH
MFEIDGDTILFNHEPVGRLTVPNGTLREQAASALADAGRDMEAEIEAAVEAAREEEQQSADSRAAEAYEDGYARAKRDMADALDELEPPRERDR